VRFTVHSGCSSTESTVELTHAHSCRPVSDYIDVIDEWAGVDGKTHNIRGRRAAVLCSVCPWEHTYRQLVITSKPRNVPYLSASYAPETRAYGQRSKLHR